MAVLLLLCVILSADVVAEDIQLQFTQVSSRGGIVDIANAEICLRTGSLPFVTPIPSV